jgi:hypothetical protein
MTDSAPVLILMIVFFAICAWHLVKHHQYFVALVPATLGWILLWNYFPISHQLVAALRSMLGITGPIAPVAGALILLLITVGALKYMLTGSKN